MPSHILHSAKLCIAISHSLKMQVLKIVSKSKMKNSKEGEIKRKFYLIKTNTTDLFKEKNILLTNMTSN